MNWISIVRFLPKGKQKFLHPHYYVYKLFPNSNRNDFRYSQIDECFYIYSQEQPVRPEDIVVEILSINKFVKPEDKEYSFAIKYSQSVKSNGKRHDLIQHMKHKGDKIESPDAIRLDHFIKTFSDIGVEFEKVIIYNRGSEHVYGKNLQKSWVEFRGLLFVKNNEQFFSFLCKGRGTGKGYGLGTMFLGEI